MIDVIRLLTSVDRVWFLVSALGEIRLAILIAISASLVAMFVDWRLGLMAQLLQSLFVGFLLSHVILPQLAMLIPLVGALAGFVLYWTGRRIATEVARTGRTETWRGRSSAAGSPMGLPFRILTLLLWALAVSTLASRFPIPEVPASLNAAAYWLVSMGLLAIILTRDPFKTGLGLLTFSNGFELLYIWFNPGLLVLGLLGIGNILTALVASYLTVAYHADLLVPPEPAPLPNSREAFLRAVRMLYRAPRHQAEDEEESEEALVP
ncbi:MAG TPA: hypothetical protein DEP84_22240 [Chloroflexi bacterium]|nr:hypothetical protein [Chloroflexota bacterium]